MKIRVGFGFDVHQLARDKDLYLGGIKIPSPKGCIAHSDGDVLIHAICDALLGASNQRDIGYHFPDNSDIYKNIDSKILLKNTHDLLTAKGYSVGNIDCTICLEEPKLKRHIPEMQKVLANILNISRDEISIKATTNEKLGYVGKKEGIAAYSVVLIEQKA